MAAVRLRKDLTRSIRRGHPWIFRDALATPPQLPDGALVAVQGKDGRHLATGFWDATSPIAVRVLSLAPVADAEREPLVQGRLRDALARRLARLDLLTTNAFRWAHGEADGLPGIHVDVYGTVAAVRIDGDGARAFYRGLDGWLREAGAGLPIRSVVDRQRRGVAGEVEVQENGVRFVVDLAHGQKGGLFLDQRDNRAEIGRRAAGVRVLNLFGYTAGFSLYAAIAGATRTDTVDLARPALDTARRNFLLNRLPVDDAHAGFHTADAFAFLEAAAARRESWDIVISDPPSFAPNQRALAAARQAYRRLHRLAAAVVAENGLFCPASCSSHFPRDEFLASIDDGARAAGRHFHLETLRGAGFDHPVLPAFPEGDYLKFAIGRLDQG